MPSNPLTDDNWAKEVTDQITTFVGTVRDKTTNHAIKAARMVVWGLLAGILGLFFLVIVIVFALRGVELILDVFVSKGRAVYLTYFLLGGVLIVFSLIVFSLRKPRS